MQTMGCGYVHPLVFPDLVRARSEKPAIVALRFATQRPQINPVHVSCDVMFPETGNKCEINLCLRV
jgi:hypothetical protein